VKIFQTGWNSDVKVFGIDDDILDRSVLTIDFATDRPDFDAVIQY
jgi:hypothetical protein